MTDGARPSLLIFAGGRATRLNGVDKALLPLAGRSFLQRILAELAPVVGERILLAQSRAQATFPDVRLVVDPTPHAGVLTALASGLASARADVCLAVACDMPFVSRALFEHLLAVLEQERADVVIPRDGHGLQPMHAVYRRQPVLAAVQAALARGDQRMTSYFGDVRVREVTETEVRPFSPDLRAFLNVNTPADLQRAEAIVAQASEGPV